MKELIIFHHDPQYLEDVKSLESYIQAELNVVNIVYTSDETSVGVKYKATADWPTLGRKLRKDIGKVKSYLPKMTSDECKTFVKEGKIDINGVGLITEDLVVTRYIELETVEVYESATDNDVIILLDIRAHKDLESMALVRALTSRVNKLRKEAGLKATDRVDIFYEYENGEEDAVRVAVTGNEENLMRSVGGLPVEISQAPEGVKILLKETAGSGGKGKDDDAAAERFLLSLAERVV